MIYIIVLATNWKVVTITALTGAIQETSIPFDFRKLFLSTTLFLCNHGTGQIFHEKINYCKHRNIFLTLYQSVTGIEIGK